MNVDVVIAIDIGAHLTKIAAMKSAYAVNDQMLTGLMRRETTHQWESLGPRDIGIVPDLGDFGSGDFDKAAKIIPLGEKAARDASDRLKRYSLSESAWKAWRAGRKSFSGTLPTIRNMTLSEDGGLSEKYVKSLLTVRPGQTLDLARLEKDIQRIYGLDLYEKVGYRLAAAAPGQDDLEIEARKRSWGPDYIQFGLALSSNLENNTTFDFTFRLNKLAVTTSGGEWRSDLRIGEHQLIRSEYYQPFGGARSFFIAPRFEWNRQPIYLIDPALTSRTSSAF